MASASRQLTRNDRPDPHPGFDPGYVRLSEDTIAELLALGSVALVHEEVEAALEAICHIAARAIRNADGASLTMLSPTGHRAAAASDPWAEQLDELQYAEHEGPCLDATRTGLLYRVRDIGNEPRWPSYMPHAREGGALSMMSVPMTVETKTMGALNVYSKQLDAFGPDEVSVAGIITGHASLAMQFASTMHGHRSLAAQMRTAMASRATIEQAKGVIMATTGCGPDEAFDQLVQQSQHQNEKLRDVAEALIGRYNRTP